MERLEQLNFFFYNYTLIKYAGDKLGLGIEILSCVDGINAHIFTVINAVILIF